jgi:hypothetical protein
MGDYERYIDSLRQVKVMLDEGKLRARIESRLNRRTPRAMLVTGGALALVFLSFAVYLGVYFYMPGNSGALSEYVFQAGDLNGDQILNYVFTE